MSEATSALPARQIGGFANLLAALDHAAAFDELGHTWFQGSGKQEAALSYAQLQQQSDACAERLRQAAPGLQPGARAGIVAATGPWFLATFCACLAFAINTSAYTAEIIAGSLRATPNGEIEAAKAMGMSRSKMYRRILLPSAMRRALPQYSNEVIMMLQTTSLASIVTLIDITGAARTVNAQYYLPFEAYITAGAFYLCLTFILVRLFKLAERRWLGYMAPRKA